MLMFTPRQALRHAAMRPCRRGGRLPAYVARARAECRATPPRLPASRMPRRRRRFFAAGRWSSPWRSRCRPPRRSPIRHDAPARIPFTRNPSVWPTSTIIVAIRRLCDERECRAGAQCAYAMRVRRRDGKRKRQKRKRCDARCRRHVPRPTFIVTVAERRRPRRRRTCRRLYARNQFRQPAARPPTPRYVNVTVPPPFTGARKRAKCNKTCTTSQRGEVMQKKKKKRCAKTRKQRCAEDDGDVCAATRSTRGGA